jgi:hypothetical protein
MSSRLGRHLIAGALALSCAASPTRSSHPDNISLAVHPGDVVLSPSNQGASLLLAIEAGWTVEQTFTVATAGKLLGIAISATRGTAGPGDVLNLTLRNDTTSTSFGTFALQAQTFGESAPGPLLSAAGPGYFDLSALDISLTPGHAMTLGLSTVSGSGVCNLVSHICTAGQVGETCFSNAECNGEIGLRFGDNYPEGSSTIVGGPPQISQDIAFAVAVRPATPAVNALTLCWQGSTNLYHIHRSEDPETLFDLGQVLTEQVAVATFGDTPPTGRIWYYAVLNLPLAFAFNPESFYSELIAPGPIVGQTFTTGAGDLIGIEIAPLLDSALPGDTLILDLFGPGDTLLASAAIPASAFPPGGEETIPAELSPDDYGPGYFDLSSFEVQVTSGQALRFELRAGVPLGVCDVQTNLCTVGKPGEFCVEDQQCDRGMRVGITPGSFYIGDMTVNGSPNPSADLAFKVMVRP